MRTAQLLFYAVSSSFLGVIAYDGSGSMSFALGWPTASSSPLGALILGATIAFPLVFVALAVLAIFRPPADVPRQLSIEDLLGSEEDPQAAYRRR